jgi:hypothetical protein
MAILKMCCSIHQFDNQSGLHSNFSLVVALTVKVRQNFQPILTVNATATAYGSFSFLFFSFLFSVPVVAEIEPLTLRLREDHSTTVLPLLAMSVNE